MRRVVEVVRRRVVLVPLRVDVRLAALRGVALLVVLGLVVLDDFADFEDFAAFFGALTAT